MPGVLVADAMDLQKMFNMQGVANICKSLTLKDVVALPLSFLCRNTVNEWVNMAQHDYPKTICEEE